MVRIRNLHTLYFGETIAEGILAAEGDVRKEVVDALRRSGYIGKEGGSPAVLLLATLNAFIRSENFEERGYLDLAVLEYTKRQA